MAGFQNFKCSIKCFRQSALYPRQLPTGKTCASDFIPTEKCRVIFEYFSSKDQNERLSQSCLKIMRPHTPWYFFKIFYLFGKRNNFPVLNASKSERPKRAIKASVVYFDQLLGAACIQKLVKHYICSKTNSFRRGASTKS